MLSYRRDKKAFRWLGAKRILRPSAEELAAVDSHDQHRAIFRHGKQLLPVSYIEFTAAAVGGARAHCAIDRLPLPSSKSTRGESEHYANTRALGLEAEWLRIRAMGVPAAL